MYLLVDKSHETWTCRAKDLEIIGKTHVKVPSEASASSLLLHIYRASSINAGLI